MDDEVGRRPQNYKKIDSENYKNLESNFRVIFYIILSEATMMDDGVGRRPQNYRKIDSENYKNLESNFRVIFYIIFL